MLIGAVLYFFLLIDAAAHSLLVTVLAYSRNNLDAVNLEVYASYIFPTGWPYDGGAAHSEVCDLRR